MIKRSLLFTVCGIALFALSGCGKKNKDAHVPSGDATEQSQSIFTAFNNRDYNDAKFLIARFVEQHPEHDLVSAFRLMIADINYEQGHFPEACEAYNFFREFYPADEHAEYAAYKAAYAKFNQAHHVTCDSGPVEATLTLCKNYKEREDYQQFRPQIDDLEATCHRHLLHKELYVVNSYIDQSNLNSAHHRLGYIKENFDLSDGGQEKVMFYEAKLAKRENNASELSRLLDEMHEAYPESQFTAMAQKLTGSGGFFG